jgi:hypothetical protein
MDSMGSIDSLIEAMRDKFAHDYGADVSAEIEGLVEIAAGGEVAISALIDCLKTDPGSLVQSAIARALLGARNEYAVDCLIEIVVDRQANCALRSLLIGKLTTILRGPTNHARLTHNLVAIMNDKQENYTVRQSALKTFEDSRKSSILTESILTAICDLLDDKDIYEAAGRVIEAVKQSDEKDVVSFLNRHMEALHKKGVPVRISQAEQIERPILAAIREAYPYWYKEDRYYIFPPMRLGMVKGQSLTLEQLTQEFGLRYQPTSFREVDRAEAGEIISKHLGHHLVYGQELMPQAQAIALTRDFLECLKTENGAETTTRYYTGWQATFHFLDEGVMIIGEQTAGCIWFSGED